MAVVITTDINAQLLSVEQLETILIGGAEKAKTTPFRYSTYDQFFIGCLFQYVRLLHNHSIGRNRKNFNQI